MAPLSPGLPHSIYSSQSPRPCAIRQRESHTASSRKWLDTQGRVSVCVSGGGEQSTGPAGKIFLQRGQAELPKIVSAQLRGHAHNSTLHPCAERAPWSRSSHSREPAAERGTVCTQDLISVRCPSAHGSPQLQQPTVSFGTVPHLTQSCHSAAAPTVSPEVGSLANSTACHHGLFRPPGRPALASP